MAFSGFPTTVLVCGIQILVVSVAISTSPNIFIGKAFLDDVCVKVDEILCQSCITNKETVDPKCSICYKKERPGIQYFNTVDCMLCKKEPLDPKCLLCGQNDTSGINAKLLQNYVLQEYCSGTAYQYIVLLTIIGVCLLHLIPFVTTNTNLVSNNNLTRVVLTYLAKSGRSQDTEDKMTLLMISNV